MRCKALRAASFLSTHDKMNDPTRFEQIVVTVHVRWGHLMPESLALQGFLVFLFFGVISSEICKLGKIEVQNA